MWDFEHGDAGRDFDISYTLPSSCARALAPELTVAFGPGLGRGYG